ncbi:MAG: hypothetical protein M5U01_01995 [Ardenticatenaceae bacterium]|nr:hypothetical protein [Ardenticatenaceae bacterium]
MNDTAEHITPYVEKSFEEGVRIMEKILSASRPGAVYSEPVTAGDYTVITASEVTAAGGFGSGAGFGQAPAPAARQQRGEEIPASREEPGGGGGGGMGGGGTSLGRPVAVITIGPHGVAIKPVVDVTKIVIAFVTAWGAMALTLARMRRARRG